MAARVLPFALVLALLSPCWASRSLPAQAESVSGTAIVYSLRSQGQAETQDTHLAVRTSAGRRVRVIVKDEGQLQGLRTGMNVVASGSWRAAPSGDPTAAAVFEATSIRADTASFLPRAAAAVASSSRSGVSDTVAAASVNAAGPTLSANLLVAEELSTLVIPISHVQPSGAACPGTSRPLLKPEELRKVVFQESNPKGPTVGSTFNQCSYNKTRITAATSKVIDTVQIGCSGTSNGFTWNASRCSWDDYNGYADAVEAKLLDKGFPLEKYIYRVYMLPPGCPLVGIAFIGCDGSPGFECRAWVGGNHWNKPQAIAHELGHNLFLGHAGAMNQDGSFSDYADSTCEMGYCCQNRCWNTPHAWQMGWISVQQLDGSSLRPGQSVSLNLASQSTTARSGVRIVPTWAATVAPLFLGFRTKTRGDADLGEGQFNRVHVYSANITNSYDSTKTTYRASMGANEAWQDAAAGIVVRTRTVSATSAAITICRKGGAETAASCAAGIDNDCNGLAGDKDTACQQLKRRATLRAGKLGL